MTKSKINNDISYNFLDIDRDNFTIRAKDGLLSIYDKEINCILAITQTNANELIKILKEFVNNGDLK